MPSPQSAGECLTKKAQGKKEARLSTSQQGSIIDEMTFTPLIEDAVHGTVIS